MYAGCMKLWIDAVVIAGEDMNLVHNVYIVVVFRSSVMLLCCEVIKEERAIKECYCVRS